MNQQVEHVETLPADLQTRLDPIQLSCLEELGVLQAPEQVSLAHRLGWLLLERVENVNLQEFLVRHPDLDGLVGRAMFLVKVLDEGNILCASGPSRTLVVRVRSPEQGERVGRLVVFQLFLGKERFELFGELKLVIIVPVLAEPEHSVFVSDQLRVSRDDLSLGDGVDERVKVERGEVRVVRLDVDVFGLVVDSQVDAPGQRVVKVRESDLVLGSDHAPDDDLVDIVELVPILVIGVHVTVQRLKLGSTGKGNVERLGGEERLAVKQVERVLVRVVTQELSSDSVQVGHLVEIQPERLVRAPIDVLGVDQRFRIVKPFLDRGVLFGVELELDRFERVDVEDVVGVVGHGLLVVERREPHSLEMTTITLLSPHGQPHRCPLGVVDGLDDTGHLVDKRNGTRNVVQYGHLPDLLPWAWNVLQQLHHGMRHVLERSQVHTLIRPEFSATHISMILHDLSDVLGGQIGLAPIDTASTSLTTLLVETLDLGLTPFPGLFLNLLRRERGDLGG